MRFLIGLCVVVCATHLQADEVQGDAAKYITDGVFKCPVNGLTFSVPKLNSDKLQVRYRELSPGITWDLAFAEELGHMVTVTYTKIRPEYPKTDEVIQRSAANIKLEMLKEGGCLEWCDFLSNEKGRVFQCVIRYPGRGQPMELRNKWLDRMEQVQLDVYLFRQYIVRDGWFVEYNIFIPQLLPTGTYDEDKLIDQWAKVLQEFVVKSSLVGPDDTYSAQMKAFKRPKTYFRFVFEDPARK